MAFPENPKSADLSAVGKFLLEEQIANHVDPHLRKLKRLGIFPQGTRIVVDENAQPEPIYRHPEFTLDKKLRTVTGNNSGNDISLSPLEFDIFNLVCSRPNRTVLNSEMNFEAWGYTNLADGTLTKGHILNIRRKLKSAGINPDILRTVHSKGYVLEDPDKLQESVEVVQKKEEKQKVYAHPLFDFYPDGLYLKIDQERVNLTKLESNLLEALIQKRNFIVSYDFLESFLNEGSDPVNLKIHISHIRRKIDNGRQLEVPTIVSRRRAGYMLVDLSELPESQKAAIVPAGFGHGYRYK